MPKPVLQSLILADHVYEDKLTGKRIIAGVFNRIIRGVKVVRQMGPPMPAAPPPPMPAAPPATPFYVPPVAAPAAPAAQPTAPPGHAAQSPAAPPQPVQPAAPPPPQPGYAAQNPATQPPQDPTTQPPSHPSAPSPSEQFGHSEQFGQASEIVQPGQPVPPTPPVPPPQQTPAAPQAYPTGQLGPPGTPLQPGQRVIEIPPTGLQSGSPFAYLSLTEIRGPNAFILELINLSDDTQLFRSDLRVDCPDPLQTVELTVPLPPISPQQAGIYALQLLHNNEILGSLRLIVEDAA